MWKEVLIMNKRQYKKSIRTRNRKLIEKYPFLLPRNVWTDKVTDNYHYDYTLADDLSDGWRKAFGTQLFDELKKALIETNYMDKFRFEDIKQKFGMLRIYVNPSPQEVLNVLEKYELLSEHYCEKCGRPAQLTSDGYWLQTICEKCWNREMKYQIEKGFRKESIPYDEAICK
jgi:hypothetical protein